MQREGIKRHYRNWFCLRSMFMDCSRIKKCLPRFSCREAAIYIYIYMLWWNEYKVMKGTSYDSELASFMKDVRNYEQYAIGDYDFF